MSSTNYYDSNAATLSAQYNAIDSALVHKEWAHLIKGKTGLACDIGAGSGRDANWLAQQGWDVIAVEPSSAMREQAEENSHPSVTWLDDKLPALQKLRALGHRFDLILLSAVWMHLPPTHGERAFRILSELLGPSGLLIISLRHGSNQAENTRRQFHRVSSEELLDYAKSRAVALVAQTQEDDQNRPDLNWETVVFRLPDDGTGSLPLLRHIIINDNKSSSYKLGLLRVLTRIAESAPGIVLTRTDGYVDIPFGIVGLYWIKQYLPLLLTHKVPQHPNANQGYGFAGDDFYNLAKLSNYDLRVGASFEQPLAAAVIGAISKACGNIKSMPVRYITYPGQNRSIFECERETVRRPTKRITLNTEFLARFGTFRIPAALWQTLGQYACWLEPAIVHEWSGLLQSWGQHSYNAIDQNIFQWAEGKRDTSVVSGIVTNLQSQNNTINCVWSSKKVSNPHIDHCFPWSRWYNNDLWNLLPTKAEINSSKGDKLPSASTMHDARTRILDWWQLAYLDSNFSERFLAEAAVSLPKLYEGSLTAPQIYEAALHQRARLKADQRLVEWSFG